MKKLLLTILTLTIINCGHPVDDSKTIPSSAGELVQLPESSLCGDVEPPHDHEPLTCGVNPWTNKGHCCTWVTEEGEEDECITSWCVNEHLCEWMVNQRSCSLKN